MSSRLTGAQRIVVTGAAQGIGRAIACALAQHGAHLILWDIDADGLSETAQMIAPLTHVQTAQVDISHHDQIHDTARAALAQGPIDGLVNNAGIYPRASILEASMDMWHTVLNTNLMGAVMTMQAFAPSMLARHKGVIINIASGRALQGARKGAHYAASKAALLSLTKSAALEFAPYVRVNAIIPGVTETAQPLAETTREELHARAHKIPLGRIGQPEDIAKPLVFLMSDDAAYITGQALVVNGGSIMVP